MPSKNIAQFSEQELLVQLARLKNAKQAEEVVTIDCRSRSRSASNSSAKSRSRSPSRWRRERKSPERALEKPQDVQRPKKNTDETNERETNEREPILPPRNSSRHTTPPRTYRGRPYGRPGRYIRHGSHNYNGQGAHQAERDHQHPERVHPGPSSDNSTLVIDEYTRKKVLDKTYEIQRLLQ
ncbi:hypothetical protein Ddc_13208 [Ditylenchus destructor]|nr:hypothetical protein Ddc_13208 [Ditylenchus destructor]